MNVRWLRSGLKKFVASIAALLLGVGALASGASSAWAAPGDQNSAVKVSDIELADSDGNPLTGQLTVGDEFVIQGTWDAATAAPQPGETFVIGLPDEFEFVLGGPPIHLDGWDPVSEEDVTWATCESENGTGDLTCTFTDAVIDRDDIHGTFEFDVNAALETTDTTVEFDLNGIPGIVELPGGGGIDDGIDLPDEVTKSGVMNNNNWSMTWTVDIPGASLVAAGGNVAHITDTLGAGHVLCDPIGLAVHTVRGDTKVDVSDLASITSGVPGESSFVFDLNAPAAGFDSGVTYRVQYQTCTPDGQIPEVPTDFSNEAQIEGWGEAGLGIGTVTSKPWHQNITKSGSVLGGADRNGKISWTVTIPGNAIAGQDKDSFTLAETLGAGHEVGTDTISGIQVVEQYGPNPGSADGLKQNITSELDVTENSVMTDSTFDLTFTIKDASDQTFKASDWRYIVTYYTYVTSDDLPDGGTKYTNSVQVNGSLTTGSATVPDRKYEKTGTLNKVDKTLDGVEHSAFTTLGWTVTIPGEKIDDKSEITLTDTLGETHQVCEAGAPTAGVAARLGVSVKVFDQISSGGMTPTPSELTDVTKAEVDGQKLTLTVGPLQGDGKFSRDYEYVISYTTCTTSGGIDAKGTEYTNEILGSGIERSGKVTMNYSGSGTGTGVARGSVTVKKLVTGPGAAFVPNGTTFDVTVEEFAPGATVAESSYTLAIPVDGDPVQGLNQRGNGWTIKLSEPTFPTVPGVTFGAPQFAGVEGVVVSEDGTVATATITPATNIAVELTNTAELGQMAVTKRLEGPAAEQVDPDMEYSFTAAIDVSELDGVKAEDRTFTLTADETKALDNLPIGAVVTVTEVKPIDDEMFTWADPVVSPTSVTITADHVETAAAVTVTNSVSRTVGTFTLSKEVTGAQTENSAVPESVTVTATWQQEGETEPTSKVLILPTDGTPVELGEQLLIDTEVTLSETPLVDGSSIAWSAPGWSGTGVSPGDNNTAIVTIGRDAAAHVALENHAATSTAGISLLKVLVGEAVSDVPDDAEFPVTAT